MTDPDDDGHLPFSLSLYALGALSHADEYAAVEEHVKSCDACRAELDEHYEVTLALAMLTDAHVRELAAIGPEPIRSTPSQWLKRGFGPARVHLRVAVLAAVLALLVGLGSGLLLRGVGGTEVVLAAATVDNHTSGSRLSVAVYHADAGRYLVRATITGLAPGVTYRLNVITADGQSHVVREFAATSPTSTVKENVAIPVATMSYFAVATTDGALVMMAACRPSTED